MELIERELLSEKAAHQTTKDESLSVKQDFKALYDYFVQKKLYPNVDFYSGIIFQAMKIPVSMFTVLFAMARMVGWIAQWR